MADEKTVIDIGIRQGQLVNLFCELEYVDQVIGIDRKKHSKLLVLNSEKYRFWCCDITDPFPSSLPESDVTVAMEVFEHIDTDKLGAAVESARRSSRSGAVFSSVPYKEKPPLYNHDKPHGHKQSFDDQKVSNVFGPEAVWTNFMDRWYLIFVADRLETNGYVPLDQFQSSVRHHFEKIYAAPNISDLTERR